MDLLAAWVVFPLAAVAVGLGLGLAVERASGRRLCGPLLVATGFLCILALANLLTYKGAVAPFALPIMALLAGVGYVLGWKRLRGVRLDRWAAVLAVGVFVSFGAPTFLTGEPTFSGSLSLPDTSNQLILADQLAHSGRAVVSPPRSSYESSTFKYLTTQYPVAAQAALGVLSPLGLQPIAWLYQPFLALLAAMSGLGLFTLVRAWVKRSYLAAAAGFLAAQPALAYSFAMQGSIKETAGITAVCVSAALVSLRVRQWAGARACLPLAVTFGAAFGVLGPAAAAYVAPLALVVAAVWARRTRGSIQRRELAWVLGVLVIAGLLLTPVLAGVSTAYQVNNATLSNAADLGNLAGPLRIFHAAGIWLGTDFRYGPQQLNTTLALIGVVLLSAAFGLIWALARRAWGPLILALPLGLISAYLLTRGSPYADAKVMAILSPAVVLFALLGVVSLAGVRRIEAVLLFMLIAGGVLGSNALAYHGVQSAPYHRYEELLEIDERFAGQGPAFLNEYDEYAGYLLKGASVQAEPESRLDYRDHDPARKPNGLVDPAHRPSVKTPLDIDDLTNAYVQSLPLLILRRSPTMSRPPANFRRVFSGRYYEVWRRGRSSKVRAHLPLGANVFAPAGRPRCSDVRRMAARARTLGGRLSFVERPGVTTFNPLRGAAHGQVPRGWFSYAAYPQAVVPRGAGRVRQQITLPAGGRYRLWLEGSFGREVKVRVDGRRVGSVAYEAGNPGQYFPLDTVSLLPGPHTVEVDRGGGSLRPGNGGGDQGSLRHIGPLVFSPRSNEDLKLRSLPASRARELCGRRLDWIEVVTGQRPPGRF